MSWLGRRGWCGLRWCVDIEVEMEDERDMLKPARRSKHERA